MIHQIIFLTVFIGLLPTILISPMAGVLIYKWFEYLTPAQAYTVTFLPGYISLVTGALTFLVWVVKEKKTLPRPPGLLLLLIALLIWINITTLYALVPEAAAFKWERTVKVVGF